MLFAILSIPIISLCLYLSWVCLQKGETKKALTIIGVSLFFAIFLVFGAGFTWLFTQVCPFV